MRTLAVLLVVASAVPATALAGKSCDELKSEIAAKIDANKVQGYKLTVVEAAATSDSAVVGTCEGGTKKLLYARGGKSDATNVSGKASPAPAASAPKAGK
jgi:hypothetical protein